jgi:hypothetical protein
MKRIEAGPITALQTARIHGICYAFSPTQLGLTTEIFDFLYRELTLKSSNNFGHLVSLEISPDPDPAPTPGMLPQESNLLATIDLDFLNNFINESQAHYLSFRDLYETYH